MNQQMHPILVGESFSPWNKKARGDFLLGDFSYADITMAAALEVIAPIAEAKPPLGPSTQSCWNDPVLADEFQDLLEWRKRLACNRDTSHSQFSALK